MSARNTRAAKAARRRAKVAAAPQESPVMVQSSMSTLDDDEIECERCRKRVPSWAAEVCFWWPYGCRGPSTVCRECQSPSERGVFC